MLPRKLRQEMFNKLSGVTMRPFFTPVLPAQVTGLASRVLEQSQQDFFINGTITSHAALPELMAGMWGGGRESALVDDALPAWLKKAMGAALSQENRCPYCEDMLLSLTHGAQVDDVATAIRKADEERIEDPLVARRLAWARGAIQAGDPRLREPVFRAAELPEALGTIVTFSYTNKISDYTMDGSPVPSVGRAASLRAFGVELRESARMTLEPGTSLDMLPPADLPEDMSWARPNARVAESLARWAGAVDRAIVKVLPRDALELVQHRLATWQGGHPPISRAWVEDDLAGLAGVSRDLARLVLVVAKASYQVDDSLIRATAAHGLEEAALVALGAYGSLAGARRVASWCAEAAIPQQEDAGRDRPLSAASPA